MHSAVAHIVAFAMSALAGPVDCPGYQEVVIDAAITEPQGVAAADLDRDGDTDLVVAAFGDNNVVWYESNGATTPMFTKHLISGANGVLSVAIGDIDRDGDADIASLGGSGLRVHWNDGAPLPAFATELLPFAVGGSSVVITDVDRDGDPDLTTAEGSNNAVAWYANDGASSPSFSRTAIASPGHPNTVFATDLDRDGDVDILATSQASGSNRIVWHESNGAPSPTFTPHDVPNTASGAHSIAAADVDRDGDTDFVVCSPSTWGTAWYESNGAANPEFTEHMITPDTAESVSFSDIDQDGDIDIIAACGLGNKVTVYRNDGEATPAFEECDIAFGNTPVEAVACDLNHRGRPDLVVTYQGNNRLVMLLGGACRGDLDGDDDTDVFDFNILAGNYGCGPD